MMDCVLPSRSGRTGQAWTRRGQVNIKNARHQDDPRPLDEGCGCPACVGPVLAAQEEGKGETPRSLSLRVLSLLSDELCDQVPDAAPLDEALDLLP